MSPRPSALVNVSTPSTMYNSDKPEVQRRSKVNVNDCKVPHCKCKEEGDFMMT